MTNPSITVGILYICTGQYKQYWKSFYASSEKFFLTDVKKRYYLFTEPEVSAEKQNESKIRIIPTENHGFPGTVLNNFSYFVNNSNFYKDCDYLIHLNANIIFEQNLNFVDIAPKNQQNIFCALHPSYIGKSLNIYPYERSTNSTACIPEGQGKYYFMGSFKGGRTDVFLTLCKKLSDNINQDKANNITACWHDESHWNKELTMRSDYKILPVNFFNPEAQNFPLKPVCTLLDKRKSNFLKYGDSCAKRYYQFIKHLVYNQLQSKLQKLFFPPNTSLFCISGGLGNQMFQYAFSRALLHQNPKTKLVYVLKSNNRRHELASIFNLRFSKKNSAGKIRYIIAKKLLYQINHHDLIFKPEVFNFHNRTLFDGYWQSAKYFQKIAKEVKRIFDFPEINDPTNLEILTSIKNTQSVAIHIRRTDYKDPGNPQYVLPEQYYEQAIKLIKEKVPDAKFYIFSDDPEWIKKHFTSKEYYVCQANQGDDSWKDMALMSYCQHNIIANSSFSWWSAWLNSNKNKIVISPKKWLKDCQIGYDIQDILEDNWIKI